MLQKIYEIVEGTTALVALLAIVGISAFSVLALNPHVSNPIESSSGGEIAGEFIDSIKDKSPQNLLINSLSSNDSNFTSQLIYLNEAGYEYTALVKPDDQFINKKFIEVHNSNNRSAAVNFDLEIIGNVRDDLIIRAFDSQDTLVLFSPETGVNNVKLTIPANSKRTLNIQFELLQNVNFSFEVKIKLN